MRRNLNAYQRHQVFLNYPFDDKYRPFAEALSFAVVAAGLLPVCALDLSAPDRARLDLLVDAIVNCHYSAHDLSRSKGEGPNNFARMNMPIEMGMAMFHALSTQRIGHRCAFFVSDPHSYKKYASDLAALDPKSYDADPQKLMLGAYGWLRDIGPVAVVSAQPSVDVVTAFDEFVRRRDATQGAGTDNRPDHAETRELMYQVCSERGWWDWRATKAGIEEFPVVPLRSKMDAST